MENKESRTENQLEALANKLEELQRTKNEGRGVSCVRTIIAYLHLGNIEKARAVCLNESDKIRNYPDIKKALEGELMGEKF